MRRLLVPGMLFVAVCWALNTVFLKYTIQRVDPLAFTGLRFLTMTPLAFALAFAMKQPVRFYPRDLPMLIACGACGYGLYQYFWVLGLANTSAFATSLLTSLAPVITLALVALLGHERVYGTRWIGAGIALLGVAIFEGAFAGKLAFRLGDMLAFGSAIIFAVFNVLSAKLLGRYTPLGLVAITMAIGTLIILPGALPNILRGGLHTMRPADWGVYAFAVVFPIVLTFPIWSWGISILGAGRASLFQFSVPIITGLLAVALLGNRIEAYEIAGTFVCIGGMAIAQLLGKYSLTALWAERTVSLK